MTVEVFTPASTYTVAGVGPYAIGHPYLDGAIRAFVTVSGAEVALSAGDITVTPTEAAVAGSLFLSPTAAATHAGRVLRIERDTRIEQDWLGVQGEREKGLEAQLDRLTYAVQELDATDARTLRTRSPIPTFVPVAGKLIAYDGTKFVSSLSAAEIAAAAAGPFVTQPIATPQTFGAVGDGVTDDRPAFAAMDAFGGPVFVPAPPVSYTFSSPLKLVNVSAQFDPTTKWADLTDGGALSAGYATSFTNAGLTSITRIPGRMFLGQAATSFAGDNGSTADGGTSVFSGGATVDDRQTAHYVPMNSQFVVINDKSSYAIAGCAVGSQNSGGKGMIAVSGVVENDIAEGRGWCFYADGDLNPGAWVVNGIEIALKNKSGVNYQYSPYVPSFGNFALRLQGGGAADFGGPATNPTTAAMIVIKGSSTYNKGIIFAAEALTGTDGTISDTGIGIAVNMARRHAIQWDAPDNSAGAQLFSSVTDGANRVLQQYGDNLINFFGGNGKQFFRISHAVSGVNYLQVASAVSGSPATLSAQGDDANINLRLEPKNAGRVQFGTRTASGDVPVTGYIEIVDEGGALRRLAVVG